jgi:hypothetical protein
MTAGRPVGERIRAICAFLDVEGPMGASALRVFLPDVERSNLGKYCSRGVGLGLLTVERIEGARDNRHVWTVVPEWRELIEQRRTTRIKPITQTPPAKRTRWTGVSSVFQMGAM